jgi:hypothetical protein
MFMATYNPPSGVSSIAIDLAAIVGKPFEKLVNEEPALVDTSTGDALFVLVIQILVGIVG